MVGRKKTVLPPDQKELPKDALLVYIIDSGLFSPAEKEFRTQPRTENAPKLKCANCDQNAILYCQQCGNFAEVCK